MKRLSVLLTVAMLFMAVGCSGNTPENTSVTTLATQENVLDVPTVKDGVTRLGDDCVESYFEWDPVEGADGYEVYVQNKYYEEYSYRYPETYVVTECNYVCGAQDFFDFRIKVRAFQGSEEERVYSDWSSFASGTSYNQSDIE